MKIIGKAFLFLAAVMGGFVSLGQGVKTAGQQTTQNNFIRNQTENKGNTRDIISNMYQTIIDSKPDLLGAYGNPSWITSLAWGKLTGTPTSLAGYGIADPIVLTSGTYSNPSWITSIAWGKVSSTPTTLAGYGITDPIVLTSGSYSNPTWITALAWSKLTGTPTTLAGYSISDAVPKTMPNGSTYTIALGNATSFFEVGSQAAGTPYTFWERVNSTRSIAGFSGYGTSTSYSAGVAIDVNATNPSIIMGANTPGSNSNIGIGGNVISISGSGGGFPGAQYGADYSASYTSRSLTDKGYVLAQIAAVALTSGSGTTASGTHVDINGSVSRKVSTLTMDYDVTGLLQDFYILAKSNLSGSARINVGNKDFLGDPSPEVNLNVWSADSSNFTYYSQNVSAFNFIGNFKVDGFQFQIGQTTPVTAIDMLAANGAGVTSGGAGSGGLWIMANESVTDGSSAAMAFFDIDSDLGIVAGVGENPYGTIGENSFFVDTDPSGATRRFEITQAGQFRILPLAGAPAVGNTLGATNVNGNAQWSALNLAGGSAYVSGLLPLANLASGSAVSVLGRSANSTGVMASITASNDNDVLKRSGSALVFGAPFTLTTTGTSGAATFSAGTLNIPQYAGGGTGWAVTGSTTITGNTTQTGSFTNTFTLDGILVTQNVLSSAWKPALKITPGAHTAMTSSTEFPNVTVEAATQTWVTGSATSVQRNVYIKAPTLAAAGVSSTSDAYNLYVESPVAGTNMTIADIITNGKWAAGFNGRVRIVNDLMVEGNIYFGFGSSANVMNFYGTSTAKINPAGGGTFTVGAGAIGGSGVLNESIFAGYTKASGSVSGGGAARLLGGESDVSALAPGDAFVTGGLATAGNTKGGDVYLQGGTPAGSGTPGKVYATENSVTNSLVRPAFITETTTARTISEADRGAIILCTNSSAIAITIPNGLSGQLSFTILKGAGAGTITITAATTLNTMGGTSPSTTLVTDIAQGTFFHAGSNVWYGTGTFN